MKRANYLALANGGVDADQALRLGLVNEVMSRERLLPRARELAAQIMQSSRGGPSADHTARAPAMEAAVHRRLQHAFRVRAVRLDRVRALP